MRRAAAAVLAVVAAGCGSARAPSPTASVATASAAVTAAPVSASATAGQPHVMVIVEENREASSVLDGQAPYLDMLARQHVVATNWYGVAHPSLPNYLALVSGSTQGVSDDGTGYVFAGPTIVDELAARGVEWRAYMEGMPSPCFGGAGTDGYAKKHDPFMYFRSVTETAAQCGRVVPFSLEGFAHDLNAAGAPAFVWVTPNLCDDGHDCPTVVMDAWLARTMTIVLGSAWYRAGGVVIVTFDEGSSDAGGGGRIATVVVSARGAGTFAAAGDHYGTLRAVAETYGVGLLGGAGSGAGGDLRGAF